MTTPEPPLTDDTCPCPVCRSDLRGIVPCHKPVAQCAECEDGLWPMYGVAPHECYWRKGPEFTLGQSTLTPFTAEDCFVPDLEDGETWDDFVYPSACGTFYCPKCQADQYRAHWARLVNRIGKPPEHVAQAMSAGTAETEGLRAKPASAVVKDDAPMMAGQPVDREGDNG